METPNLNYINELSDGDKAFESKLLKILKDEFEMEREEYNINFKNKLYHNTADNVHKIKHKILILGLEKSYYLAEKHEEHLKNKNTSQHLKFEMVLNIISQYIKNI